MTSISQNINQSSEKSNFLRNAMRLDAVFGVIGGLIAIIDAAYLVEFMGAGDNLLYMVIGALLLVHSAALFYFSRSHEVPRWFVWYALEADAVWVLVSLGIVFTGAFGISDAGKWVLFILSDAVLAFAFLKYAGLRRLS